MRKIDSVISNNNSNSNNNNELIKRNSLLKSQIMSIQSDVLELQGSISQSESNLATCNDEKR
jgi:hypothetical protein